MSRLLSRLGLRWPILQAPTGSIAGPELAAAVSEAGAMGGLGLTWTAPHAAAEAVAAVRARTDRPFFVNFVLHFAPDPLPAALDAGAPVVTFSWGDAAPHVGRVHAAGALVGVQVATTEGARRAADAGADFLICQGVEAGGHVQSTSPLWGVLPRVVEAAAGGLPVFAAGGIADGAGVARAVRLGAAGAMLGTRFVATAESRAHDAYKRALVEARGEEDTALTVCFDGGWPYAAHRVLRNSTFAVWEAAGSPAPGARPGEGEAVAYTAAGEPILRYEDAAPRAGHEGDLLAMCLYAGAAVGGVTDIPSAAELVARLGAEYEAALVGG